MNLTAETAKSRGANVPRLAMINDMAGFGRCSTTVSLPVISAMEVQVCPVPTSILSNHFAFPKCHFHDCTPYMRDYIGTWRELDISFDGLYCGFLGEPQQAAIVNEFLDEFKPPLFLLDPVMGDHGKMYSTVTPEKCRCLRTLSGRAQILTPNLTEACLLTDTPYREGLWSDEELEKLCGRLARICPGRIVITGLYDGGRFSNCIWQDSKMTTCSVSKTGASRPGTGDLFASIIAADALHGRDFAASVKKAADFVALCIKVSEEAGIPIPEGVIFERCLGELIFQNQY